MAGKLVGKIIAAGQAETLILPESTNAEGVDMPAINAPARAMSI